MCVLCKGVLQAVQPAGRARKQASKRIDVVHLFSRAEVDQRRRSVSFAWGIAHFFSPEFCSSTLVRSYRDLIVFSRVVFHSFLCLAHFCHPLIVAAVIVCAASS